MKSPFTIASKADLVEFARELSYVSGELLGVRVPCVLSPRIVEGSRAGGLGRLPAPVQVKVRSNDGLISPWMSFEGALQWCRETDEAVAA